MFKTGLSALPQAQILCAHAQAAASWREGVRPAACTQRSRGKEGGAGWGMREAFLLFKKQKRECLDENTHLSLRTFMCREGR